VATELLAPEVWQQVKEVFERAAPLDEAARAALLDAVAEPRVRREVDELLRAHDDAGTFLDDGPRAAPQIGEQLGPYRLLGPLGAGGMGEVFRGYDPALAREVAIKVLRALPGGAASAMRFAREARAIAALSHRNVLAIYGSGEHDGIYYLVTELLVGETLRARLRRAPRPTLAEVLGWGAAIANGLAAAHAAGIVHRDLKLENVFLTSAGEIKILDFGLARMSAIASARAVGSAPQLTASAAVGSEDPALAITDRAGLDSVSSPGMALGTAGYLAPEQARGDAVTAAADLFALGAMLYELLSGERAFPGATALERLRAVLELEPPELSSVRADVPRWLSRVIARCLAKDVSARFESARDLAFALQQPTTEPKARNAAPSRRRHALRKLALAAGLLGAAAAALLQLRAAVRPTSAQLGPATTKLHPLTYGGLDREPAVSPDGGFLAFTSERDGLSRIWIKQLESGSETALTSGPDRAPRFSPDGNQVLFTRAEGERSSLYRVDLLGSEAHKVVDDASEGDWSPDGREVAFVRTVAAAPDASGAAPADAAANLRRGTALLVMIARLGGGTRELYRLRGRPQRGRNMTQYLRWSPDGASLAVTGLVTQPGAPQEVLVLPVAGGAPRVLQPPSKTGLISAVVWDGAGALLYSQAGSVSGNVAAGSSGQIVRQTLAEGAITPLLWTTESSLVVDRWPRRGLVFDVRSRRENLRELTLRGEPLTALSRGTSTDRQPVLDPDGTRVVFSSNRDGTDLDLWQYDRRDGASRRLTDHAADDWDPALSPDGKLLLWSSNRSGTFEVWVADRDGLAPRQVTRDGDAENPSIGADGAWIVYGSGAPDRAGVWRVRPDGSEPRLLVPEAVLPEISPDGRHALFLRSDAPSTATIGVVRVADGEVLPFRITVEIRRTTTVLLGRARWTPGGDAIAFVGQDERGATGVFVQEFDPARDTAATRRPLVGFDRHRPVESFDVDARGVVLAEPDPSSDVMVAEGLAP
jgi:eukaryotic-like serine/threonine-protein kinase